jgi:hypothetical protein
VCGYQKQVNSLIWGRGAGRKISATVVKKSLHRIRLANRAQ